MIEEGTNIAGPSPQEAPGRDRELRRSRDNKVVAGVAAGIGRYFDLDPVIVRIAFVVLAMFGGSGVLLYLVAWVLITKEGNDESVVRRALKGDTRGRQRGVMVALLLLGAVLIVSGPTLWFADIGFGAESLFFPMLLIAGGVALLLWPEETDWSAVRSRVRYRDPAAADPTVAPPTAADPTVSTDLVVRADGLAPSDPPPPFPPLETGPETSAESDDEPGRTFPITSLTMAVLLVLTGIAVLLERADVIALRPVTYLAGALVVVGCGLVASAFVGRARGLIVLGVMILPVLWFASVVDIEWWSGVGQETIVVDDLDDLEAAYHHGIGELIIDLTDLDLNGETVELEVGLTIGKLVVMVPADTEVDIDLDGRIGELTVERLGDPLIDDGVDIAIDTTLPGDNGHLDLDLDIGIGDASVVLAA